MTFFQHPFDCVNCNWYSFSGNYIDIVIIVDGKIFEGYIEFNRSVDHNGNAYFAR